MDCAIWLNRRKVFSADEIAANFDIAAIRGYFLGGSLIKWLIAHNGKSYADRLAELDPSDPALNDRLAEVFGQKKRAVPAHKADENLIRAIDLLRKGAPTTSSAQGSFQFGSFAWGSFSYNYGSFGSFRYNSFTKKWQWEWEWESSSFRTTSFGGSYRYGSYRFIFGSYNLGSFMFGGSFRLTGSMRLPAPFFGAPYNGSCRVMTCDEYDEIMYRTLNMCPLDRFGYGIHII